MFGLIRHSRASRVRHAIAALCTLVMVAGLADPAFAGSEYESQLPEENATSNVVVDAMFLRPLGLVALATGVGLFLPVAVITLITRPQQINEPFGWLVVAPARYVWVDGLGEH